MIKCSHEGASRHERWSFLSIIMRSGESKCTTRFELLPLPLFINKVQSIAIAPQTWKCKASLWTVNFNCNQPTYTQLPRGWWIFWRAILYACVFVLAAFSLYCYFTLFLSIIIMYYRVCKCLFYVLAIWHDLNLI